MSRLASGAFVVLVALGTSACGDSSGADTPLTTQLDAVDDAAVAEDADQLVSAVGNLLRAVDDAEAAGNIDSARADRIRRAAEALLEAAAPAGRRPPTEPAEPPTATTPPAPEDDEEEDDADASRPAPGEPHGKDKDKNKSEGKAKSHHRAD